MATSGFALFPPCFYHIFCTTNRLGGPHGAGNFVQHMGKWRADTPYVANRSWDWHVDLRPDPTSLISAAATDSPLFWDWLASQAVTWGLIALKQDHTQEQLAQTTLCREEMGFTARMLRAQAQALARHGATMQAGGYTLIGWFNSVTLGGVVTHARTSSDYACWYNSATGVGSGCTRSTHGMSNYPNYRVASGGMLAWSLGMLPYKDTFFSSQRIASHAPCMACLYTNWTEPYP